jgi:hypothetical protein
MESKVEETEDSNTGGDIFPGLNLSARVNPVVAPSKPVSSQALSRTVDSAWLARYPAIYDTRGAIVYEGMNHISPNHNP